MRSERFLALALACTLAVAGVAAQRDGATAAGGWLTRSLTAPDPQALAYFGDAVAIGDVNADGRADVIVGAWGETVGGRTDQGRAYVFSGQDGSLLRTLDTPDPQNDAQFGHALAAADVDGDSKADVIVGAPDESVNGAPFGRVYVFSGADGSLLRTLVSPNPLGGDGFGDSLATGDVDGDGVADVIVGASNEAVGHVYDTGHGRVYVFSGRDGSLLRTFDTPHPQLDAHFGAAVASADVNRDGVPDVIVGAASEDVGGNTTQGRAYVFSGADGSLLYELTTPNPESGAEFGWSVAAADVNADARADVLVGAWGETVGGHREGRVYAFSGADGSQLLTLTSPDSQADAYFGWSVTGRVAGDGKAEVIVGAIGETVSGNAFTGRTYAFAGADGSLRYVLATPNSQADGTFGVALATGDVDGDGAPDAVVGASGEMVDGNDLQGRAYVFLGRAASVGGIAVPPDVAPRPAAAPPSAHHTREIALAAAALTAVAAGGVIGWRRRRVSSTARRR